MKYELKYEPVMCYHCKYCFRDDWYGVCCNHTKSEHFTRSWDLPVDFIEDCEYFEEER